MVCGFILPRLSIGSKLCILHLYPAEFKNTDIFCG